MKNLFYISIVSALLIVGLSGCYKTCESPFAVNYTLKGNCIDLTDSLVGTYSGQLLDSVVGVHSTTSNNISIVATKVDDSHVMFVSSGTSSFITYSASIVAMGNQYYMTIPSQTSSGLTVVGAGTYFGSPADGIYTTATKQLVIYSLAGTEYQGFSGTLQQ